MWALVPIVILMTGLFCVQANATTLEEIRTAAGTISSLSAGFTQEKQMKILVKPLISKGIIRYQFPNLLRFEYQEPIKNILIMKEKTISRYIEKGNGFVLDKASAMGAMDIVMDEISRWIKGDFDTTMFTAAFEGKPEPGRIILKPRDNTMNSFIQAIELVLSDHPGVFKEVIIRENENSYTRLIFDTVMINTEINPDMFNIPK